MNTIVNTIVPVVGALALVGLVGVENAGLGVFVAAYLVLAYLNGRIDQHAFSNTERGKLLSDAIDRLDAKLDRTLGGAK